MWAVLHDEVLFPSDRYINPKATLHHDFTAENWHRVYSIFRQYNRSVQREGESVENQIFRKQNRVAVPSVFLQPHEIGSVGAIRRLMLFENNMDDVSVFFHLDFSDDDMKIFFDSERKIRRDDDLNFSSRLSGLQEYQNFFIKITIHEKSVMNVADVKNVCFFIAIVKNFNKK